jgi:hypothetical protein
MMRGFLKGNASVLLENADEMPPKEVLKRSGYSFFASGVMENFSDMPCDEMIKNDIVWVGTPNDIIERIEAVQNLCAGLTEVAINRQSRWDRALEDDQDPGNVRTPRDSALRQDVGRRAKNRLEIFEIAFDRRTHRSDLHRQFLGAPGVIGGRLPPVRPARAGAACGYTAFERDHNGWPGVAGAFECPFGPAARKSRKSAGREAATSFAPGFPRPQSALNGYVRRAYVSAILVFENSVR